MISVSSVQPIRNAHGLKSPQVRQFTSSSDPEFAAKFKDIVGLYVDPPDHAVVFRSIRRAGFKLSIAPNQACPQEGTSRRHDIRL